MCLEQIFIEFFNIYLCFFSLQILLLNSFLRILLKANEHGNNIENKKKIEIQIENGKCLLDLELETQ